MWLEKPAPLEEAKEIKYDNAETPLVKPGYLAPQVKKFNVESNAHSFIHLANSLSKKWFLI